MSRRGSVMSLLYVLAIMKKMLILFTYSGKIITTFLLPQLSKEEGKQLMG